MHACFVVFPCLWLLWFSLADAAGKSNRQHFSKFNNEDTRGTSMFLNVSMSIRSFWWMQVCLNLFQHLSSIYFIWCTARYNWIKAPVPTNNTRSTKLRGAQRSPELVFRSTDLLPENLILHFLTSQGTIMTVQYENYCTLVSQSEYRYFYVLAIILNID